MQDVARLLQRAEAGEQLSESERRRALEFLLFSRGELWPTALLAEYFHADAETIARDLAEIRAQAEAEARRLDVQSELLVLMRQHVAAIDKYLAENADRLRPQDFTALLRERRELVQSVLAQIARLQGW